MKLQRHGKNILKKAEISGITQHGVWMLINEFEYYLSFKEFPLFKSASIENIYNFEFRSSKYLRWSKLDIDLEVDSLVNLEKYPLKYID